MDNSLAEYLDFAIKVSKDAGKLNLAFFEKPKKIRIKKDNSLVTEADIQSETLVRNKITKRFPEHGILGEESGLKRSTSHYYWCIDPLDGTTNFVRGIPVFAVSIALLYRNKPIVGVVYDPVSKNLFCAAKGEGSFLNNTPLKPPKSIPQKELMFAVQSEYDGRVPGYLNQILKKAKIRSIGVASLHVCYVAAGWVDCYIGDRCSLWDIAGGSIILTEAGGVISKPNGKKIFPLECDISTYVDTSIRCIAARKNKHKKILSEYFSSYT